MALSSTAPLRELYKTLGDKYRKLTKEEKKPYIDMALADKKRYERELAELKSHMAENPGIYQAYPPELQAKFGLYDLRSHAGLFFQLVGLLYIYVYIHIYKSMYVYISCIASMS
jgi:hypothetical protein